MPLFVARIVSRCPCRPFINTTHRLSSTWANFPAQVSDPSNKVQIYSSKSPDPVFNLAIEHYLFQKTPPGSKVLFFYKNSPCVVIGRNQNPWLEVNLNLIGGFKRKTPDASQQQKGLHNVNLVRRRSGGGTVFHDQGNVNWSVICDLNQFTRDKHAEMVVRALRKLGIDRARVNERHDIVLDQGTERSDVDDNDTHVTPYTTMSPEIPSLKVSGSAYKLARNRALHHGTALLLSPNLPTIPLYLRSPAKPFITAKGVESVSSPVGNIGLRNTEFETAVRQEFNTMYGGYQDPHPIDPRMKPLWDIPEVQKGYDELKSLEWTYLQTPQFSFSTQPVAAEELDTAVSAEIHDRQQRMALIPAKTKKFSMNVKNGLIQDVDLGMERHEQALALTKDLTNQKLHQVDWQDMMRSINSDNEWNDVISFLDRTLPRRRPQNRTGPGFRSISLTQDSS